MSTLASWNRVAEVVADLDKNLPEFREPCLSTELLVTALRRRGHTAEYSSDSVRDYGKDIVEYGYIIVDDVQVPVQIVVSVRGYQMMEESIEVRVDV